MCLQLNQNTKGMNNLNVIFEIVENSLVADISGVEGLSA